jgi:hypothetical protein
VKRLAFRAILFAALGWAGVSGAQVSPAAPTALAVGDWKLTPVFDVRSRVEARHDLDEEDRAMLFERVRLGVDAQDDGVESRIVLQDARALAFDTGSFVAGPSSTASTGVYEAWVQATARSGAPSFVRLGRQAVTWGEGRLLGVSDASPAGRALYALRARWSLGDGAVELLVAALEEPPSSAAFAPDFYGELVGVRGEWSLDPLLALEVYGLGRLAQVNPTDATTSLGSSVKGETYTGSLRLHGDGRSWAWSAEGAYQLGYASAYAASRAAWAAAGHVEHVFELAIWRPTVRLGVSYASGDTGGGQYRAFDPILPDVQVWHGAMDLFTWSNEEEVNASVSIAPWVDGVVAVEYRYARLAVQGGLWRSDYQVALGAAPGDTDAALGHEIDAKLAWTPWAPVDLEAGYSAFIVGEAARSILTASHAGSVPDVSHMGYAEARVGF